MIKSTNIKPSEKQSLLREDTVKQSCLDSAERVQRYLFSTHWQGDGLYGPDPGIRWNYRIGRFVKSYLRFLPWRDDLYYLQGQGYWVLANWELFDRTGQQEYRDCAVLCCESILRSQCEDGAWIYPNREWKGRVATVEGIWASLALMESYRRTGEDHFLDGALRWHNYVMETTGFQKFGDQLAINYFAYKKGSPVPNNSADALRFFSALADVTGDANFLEPCSGLVAFLASVQKPTGEFPYLAKKRDTDRHRPHFQCFQYNAFMCLGMMQYFEITGDANVRPLIEQQLEFLTQGITPDGAVHYECGIPYRHVTYHAAVVAAAFVRGGVLGFTNNDDVAYRAFQYVMQKQRSDGSVIYSRGDYRVLSDQRSYPRYLAMIMYHLLHPGLPTRTLAATTQTVAN